MSSKEAYHSASTTCCRVLCMTRGCEGEFSNLGEVRGHSLHCIDNALHILCALQNERLLWRPL